MLIDCCKNCESLMYYDGYFCGLGIVQDIENKEELQIDDIENAKCKMFLKRESKFWVEGEF